MRVAAESGEVRQIERPRPQVGDGQVLVAVEAFGVGIHDRYFIPPQGPFPYTIGTEGAGVVTAVGPAASAVEVGQRVMLATIMLPTGGTWADFAVAPESVVTPIPESLDVETAAGLHIPGDASVAILRTLQPAAGSTLFIAGGSGAIGTLLIQLAQRQGARVAVSASAANHDHVLSLGAELAVDYRDADWPQQVRRWAPNGVDSAVAILPNIATACLPVVRDGGQLVTVSGDTLGSERGIRVEQFQHLPQDRIALAELVADVAAGRISVVLERIYDFDDAVAALEKTETRHARGKLVVRVTPPVNASSRGGQER